MDSHDLYWFSEVLPGELIVIAQQVPRDLVKREGCSKLLSHPLSRGMGGDVAMHNPAPIVRNTYRTWKRIVGTVKKPTDTIDKILFPRMERIVHLIYTTGWQIANAKAGLAKSRKS